MNTIPLAITIACLMSLLFFLRPRKGQNAPAVMPFVIRALFCWARFCWSVAVAVEAGYHRFREVQAELIERLEAR